MVTLLKKQIIIFVAVLIISINVSAQTLSPDNWTSYCGWHYGSTPAWGGWVREPLQNKTGMSLADTATMQVDTIKLNSLFTSLASLDTVVDIMLLDGGVGGARDTARLNAYMKMIQKDNGAFWKKIVYKQCMKLAQLSNGKDRLYYQLGNEISSASCASSFRYWQGQPYGSGVDYDHFIIPYFVENFIAPTIEAIDSASLDYYGQKGMINICMGSITNAGNQKAKPFLDSLLNYTIKGTYAPSLAGKRVYELIHIITIHYMMGNSSANVWENNINSYANWFGTGRIRGIWSTEEVGIRAATAGRGASVGAKATFRYLKWSIANNYNARTARTNYWAWNLGPVNTRVDDFNQELFSFLGKVKLQYVDSLHTTYTNPSNFEWHGFLNDSLNKGILATFANTATAQNISQIKLVKTGWGNINNAILTRYDTLGRYNIPISMSFSTDSVTVSFASQNLYKESVLLLKINTQPLIVGVDDVREKKELPWRFELEQNYPNPFNPSTTIRFSLPKREHVTLKVYDMLGREIATLVDGVMDTGEHAVMFSANNLPNGVYFYQITTQSFSKVQKAVLLK